MKIQILPSGNWVEHRLDQSVRLRESLKAQGFDATIGGEVSSDAVLFVQFPGGASVVDDPEPDEAARRILDRWDRRRLVMFETPRGPFSTALAMRLDALAVLDELDLRPLRGDDPFPGHCGFFGQATRLKQAGLTTAEKTDNVERVELQDSAAWFAAFRRYLAGGVDAS